MRNGERGAVLLEVLAAVLILGVAGLALVELVADGTRAETVAAARERELGDMERLLVAHTLLTGVDLDRRLGVRKLGQYRVEVQRPEPALYRIAIGRLEAPEREELVTVVWRKEAGGGS